MAFTTRDIRPGMDVYDTTGRRLGSVGRVTPLAAPPLPASIPDDRSSDVSGEMLGPMPTQTIGNTGPRQQSANNAFAARNTADAPEVGGFAVTSWWPLPIGRTVQAAQVMNVSLERVVISTS
jgi:hypothetical protein